MGNHHEQYTYGYALCSVTLFLNPYNLNGTKRSKKKKKNRTQTSIKQSAAATAGEFMQMKYTTIEYE